MINVRLDSLFDVVYGTNLEFNKLEEFKMVLILFREQIIIMVFLEKLKNFQM